LIALIFMYYVFIAVLVAPSKFNFPEMTPSHIAIFLVAPLQKPPAPSS
jgi:hypothetical protein